jgi:hypothetical protein
MPGFQATEDVTFGEHIREDDGCFLSHVSGVRYLKSDTNTLVEVDL